MQSKNNEFSKTFIQNATWLSGEKAFLLSRKRVKKVVPYMKSGCV